MENPPNDEEETWAIWAIWTIVACGAVLTRKEERVLTGTCGEFEFVFSVSG